MKRFISVFALMLLLFSFTSCEGVSVSTKRYDEISNYVLENIDALSPEKDVEFFDYESKGFSIGATYYGYYYAVNNDILLPDFYLGNDIDKIKNDKYESDGGTYFGKPNNGTDWCFIKKITDKWYYYELHWA